LIDEPKTLSFFEQIKEFLQPSVSRHRVVENPVAVRLEAELKRRSTEPTDLGHYQKLDQTRQSFSRRNL
jgi:hypothetical protein